VAAVKTLVLEGDLHLFEGQDPDGAVRFYEALARWHEEGDLEGLIVE
jgi:hypothetical protein